jgi:hypothetical protein
MKPVQLSWWMRASNRDQSWASGCRGRYTIVALGDGRWSVDHQRGSGGGSRRQLGVAATAAAARAIAQIDHDRIRSAEAPRP